MQDFERVYMRTLRHAYDTEMQLSVSTAALAGQTCNATLKAALEDIESQSLRQLRRIEGVFNLLYLEPRAEPSWVTTALLREASDSCASQREGGTQGCAAALLAIKRYEITLYEALLRWSEQCHLVEPLADIRRCIAEELVQASVLSELAFEDRSDANALTFVERSVLH